MTATTKPASISHPVRELLARYHAILAAAWETRHELAGPARLADERAFLPAALSLQETPPHPAPRRTALTICALFTIALGWACFSEVDVVAVAQGRIVVSERSKLVQPLETAVISAIHVRDGDVVRAGQLLVELDATAAQADARRVQEEHLAALSDALRAEALLRGLTTMPGKSSGRPVDTWPALGLVEPGTSTGLEATQRQAAQVQLQTEWQDIRAQLAKLTAEQVRRQAEEATVREQLAKLQATVPLARQREADFQLLRQQGFVAGHAEQDRQRERIEQERDLATAEARLIEAQAAVTETRQTQTAYQTEIRRTLQERAAQARLKLAQLTQENNKARQRSRQMRLVAPVAGTVQQLAVHTAGGVVTPAQVLMVIVPGGTQATNGTAGPADITAEVSIDNKDIGFVQAGQHAEVKLETFNFTRYGTVPATVEWVTADAVVQQQPAPGSDGKPPPASAQAVFPARLVLAHPTIQIDGKTLRLSPGLNLSAEIKIGRRRVIDYLLSPVQQRVSESLRER